MSTSTLIRRLCGAAICAFVAGALAAQTPIPTEQRIQRIVDAIPPAIVIKGGTTPPAKLAARMAELHVPGVSIAFIHEGKIEWARGFGITALRGSPVNADTLFQAASISKSVAAMAVLHLAQAGKISLDTDVNTYLKTWKVPANSFTSKAKVTVRELLIHTAGLTVHGFAGYAGGAPVPTLLQVLDGDKPANSPPVRVEVQPGTVYSYSGGGYVVLQQLMEDVTGEPFPKLMRDIVLGPAGMTRSTFEQPLPKDRMAEVATPYRADGHPIPGGPHVYPEMASAGLWSTPSDLARFAIELQESLAGTSNRVLSANMARQMLTAAAGPNHQGLGPGLGGSAKHPYFEHGGANEGYRCNLVAYNQGDGIVIMTDADNGSQLADELQRSVAHEYGWPDFQPVERTVIKLDPKTLDSYAGAYQSPRGIFTVTREGFQLFVQVAGQRKLAAFPESQRGFFLTDFNAQFKFELDAQGKVTGLTIRDSGKEETAKRLDDATSKRIVDEAAATAAAIAKRFREQKPAPESETTLRRLIDELRRGQPDYSQMSPVFAALARQQLADMKSNLNQLGDIDAATFRGVDQSGADIYEVKFKNGTVECRIALTQDGKVDGLAFRPM